MVRELGAAQAVLACTIGEMCDATETGEREISGAYLMELLGYDERKKLRRHIQELRDAGVIEYKSGDGRGHATLFKKGVKFAPLYSIKGDKNVPLYNEKGGQKCTIKWGKNDPQIIKYNKNNISPKGDANAPAQARDGVLSLLLGANAQKGERQTRYPFSMFWAGYQVADKYQPTKDECECIWQYISERNREKIIERISAGNTYPNPKALLDEYRPQFEHLTYLQYCKRYETDAECDGWRKKLNESGKLLYYYRKK